MTQFLKSKAIEGFIIIVLLIAAIVSRFLPAHIKDIFTIAALILGPVFAIWFSKYLEDNREQRQQEWQKGWLDRQHELEDKREQRQRR